MNNIGVTPFVDVVILGKSHRMLVDSGSSSSFISIPLYDILVKACHEINISEFPCRFTVANGRNLDVRGKVTLSFSLGREMYCHEFLVADIDLTGIIGNDFLMEYAAGLFVADQYMVINGSRIDLSFQGKDRCSRIKLSKAWSIPPEREVLISGQVTDSYIESTALMAEPCKTLFERGLLMSNAIVDARNPCLSVLNVTDKPVRLNKGTLIATVHEVDMESITEDGTNVPVSSFPSHLESVLQSSSEHLTESQAIQVKDLLIQYQDVFISPNGKLGRNDWVKHKIDTGSSKPIKIPPRRVPIKQREIIDKEVSKMIENDVIEPSCSAWSSPVLLCSKKDGSVRFCIDYRKVNAVTQKDSYPLPRIDDCLDSLGGNAWFHTLDLASGYWQCEIEEEDRPKTAFATHSGLYQFKVLPFGLCNAPAVFERLMELVLKGLNYERCLCYLDDVVIFGKSFDEAILNLAKVLNRFRKANLKVRPSKCQLFRTKCNFLGHVIQKDGISCDPDKISAVNNLPPPSNLSELKSLLGLVGYYRKFIPDFATIAYPLTKLTQKNVQFCWDMECDNALKSLQGKLTNAPILSFPTEDDMLILDTDASLTGIGAVLSQVQNGTEHVLCYASKTLSKQQQRYCTTYRELLAVVTFVKHFRHYLWGRNFLLRTDHASLLWLKNFKNPEGMLARWLSILETYDMTIEHRKGSKHLNADALSRFNYRKCKNDQCTMCSKSKCREKGDNPPDPRKFGCNTIDARAVQSIAIPDTADSDYSWLNCWSVKDIKKHQYTDRNLKKIMELKTSSSKKPPRKLIASETREVKTLWGLWESLVLQNGILYYRWFCEYDETSNLLMVAPSKLRQDIFKELHVKRIAGHFGRNRTLSAIRKRFFWPGMSRQISLWTKECEICQRKNQGFAKSPLQQFPTYAPLDRVAIDILECPLSDNGNQYVIVVGDYFTKWVECFPVPDHTALTVADKLSNEFITRFGVPKTIHTDQGREFESHLFRILCEKLEIEKTRTSPYRPQSDGFVERMNRTLIQILSLYVNENHSNWDEHLPFLLMAYRSTEQESTGFTPNKLMLGREISLPIDIIAGLPKGSESLSCPVEYIEWFTSLMIRVFDFAHKNLKKAAVKQKNTYDTGLKPKEFKENTYVWRWYPPSTKSKLGLGWTGPYKVLQRLTDVTYKVQKDATSKPIVVHVDHFKQYEGTDIPSNWKSRTDDNISNPDKFVTTYGRQVKQPDRFCP